MSVDEEVVEPKCIRARAVHVRDHNLMVVEAEIELREERHVEVHIPRGRERRVVGSHKVAVDLVRGCWLTVVVGWLERSNDLNART